MKLYFNPTSTLLCGHRAVNPLLSGSNSLRRKPPLACTRVRGQNAPDPGASDG